MDCRSRFNYKSASKKDRLQMAEKILCMAYILSIFTLIELVGLTIYIRINNTYSVILPIFILIACQMILISVLISVSKKIKLFENSNPENIKV